MVFMKENREDQQLIEQILKGVSGAFGILYERYEHPIFQLMYRLCGNYEVAADLTQEAFIKMYNNLAKYAPEYKFFSWFYRLALNHALNCIKKEKPSAVMAEEIHDETVASPEQQFIATEQQNQLLKIIHTLDEKYRLLILLFYYQELSYTEIAAVLSVPAKRVKSRLFTARKLLTEKLNRD
ncbi:MAG: sigma-70 family RNA polymerase sigma factor [Bacteroidia bacterium]|nr:sigma-70 family RNA polymerase sigma factor [Bacteroidia bacterium]